ncbi:hypothetical protein [Symbiopectobacterium purcellii]|uniref:Uncharacterized protein n=1 Tax=Symbiopectobacterium purcellii TaxID=2871826 RepID=A0ABX9ANZ9_9ENTR|nr:hypothetical protein [Symbiopectobacterium purcellii]QZN96904.1 hypothetical protein K6K13_05755 [Symbiopectobacterium purcellii]
MESSAISFFYASYFPPWRRWPRSVTRITYWCKLIGIPSLAALPQRELFRVKMGGLPAVAALAALSHPNHLLV